MIRWTRIEAQKAHDWYMNVAQRSFDDVGRHFGVSRARVGQVFSRHGLPSKSRFLTRETVRKKLQTRRSRTDVVSAGKLGSLREACLMLGVSDRVAIRLFNEHGVEAPRHNGEKHITRSDLAKAIRLYKTKRLGLRGVAALVGYKNPTSVSRLLRNQGVKINPPTRRI